MADFQLLKPAQAISSGHALFNADCEIRIATLQLPEKFAWIYRLTVCDDKLPDSTKADIKAIIAEYDSNLKIELEKAKEALSNELVELQAKKKTFLDIANEHF
jgi:hypothetical protein